MNWNRRLATIGLCLWLTSFSYAAWGFSFVVFGDNCDGDQVFQDMLNKIEHEGGDAFAVNCGDAVLSGKEGQYKQYLQMVKKFKVEIHQVPGNHDLMRGSAKYFIKYFGPLYYSFDYENSHFVVLNNAFAQSFDAEQFAWLKKDLAANQKAHTFVFLHRPVFDPSEIYSGYVMSGRKVIEELMALFKKHKVEYVFAGHIHGFSQTKRDGINYIVTGGAGSPLRLPRELGGFYNYVRITVDGTKIKDEVKMIYE
ncbi:MAG: metallophosphoesterase [Candidatus Margulisiibacteriota bacterium]